MANVGFCLPCLSVLKLKVKTKHNSDAQNVGFCLPCLSVLKLKVKAEHKSDVLNVCFCLPCLSVLIMPSRLGVYCDDLMLPLMF